MAVHGLSQKRLEELQARYGDQAVLAAALIFSGCKLRADKGLAPAPPLACRDAPLLAPAGGVSGGEESAAWGGGGRQQLRACSILITGANSGE